MLNLRRALEHINDPIWLRDHAALDGLLAHPNPAIHLAEGVPVPLPSFSSNHKAIGKALAQVWKDWHGRAKSPLQQVIWHGMVRLFAHIDMHQDDGYPLAALLLSYFRDPRPKQSEVIALLALSRATYFRYLERAILQLREVLLETLGPAMRLEAPAAKPLIQREAVQARSFAALREGQLVALIGGSGLGKSSLGAALAQQWRSRVGGASDTVFWYTFRRNLTDQLSALLFALAYFLKQQGEGDVWAQIALHPDGLPPAHALALIRESLHQLHTRPVLLCFDEVDVLLPQDLQDPAAHAQLRAFLEDLAQAPRNGSAILLIGQRLLIAPEPAHLFELNPFDRSALDAWLGQQTLTLAVAQREHLLAFTRGNPLLIQLFLALQQREPRVTDVLPHMVTPASLDWLLARIRRHLAPTECELLDALSVYEGDAPGAAFRKAHKPLQALAALNLVTISEPNINGAVIHLHPALRELLHRQLPHEQRLIYHLQAATVLEQLGAFTEAAHHYVQAARPDMAVWLWHTQRDLEIKQGNAGVALALFQQVSAASLPKAEDRRVHALLLAHLCRLAGLANEGLQALDGANVMWPTSAPSTARMHELRGDLLTLQGQVDAAVNAFRAGLDVLESQPQPALLAQTAGLHIDLSRRHFHYQRDLAQARIEALRAQHDVAILQGELADAAGDYAEARRQFSMAIEVAEALNESARLAKSHEALGILELHHEHVDEAKAHIELAADQHRAYGNLVCAIGVANNNLAAMYVLARQYAHAIAPAERALTFAQQQRQPFLAALAEANLAEAYANLGDADRAERYIESGLRAEEVAARPYLLYVLGHVHRLRGQYRQAERVGREAIHSAEENEDLWALGPAWRTLGDTYAHWHKPTQAHEAWREALGIYQRLGVAQEVAFIAEFLSTKDMKVQ